MLIDEIEGQDSVLAPLGAKRHSVYRMTAARCSILNIAEQTVAGQKSSIGLGAPQERRS